MGSPNGLGKRLEHETLFEAFPCIGPLLASPVEPFEEQPRDGVVEVLKFGQVKADAVVAVVSPEFLSRLQPDFIQGELPPGSFDPVAKRFDTLTELLGSCLHLQELL